MFKSSKLKIMKSILSFGLCLMAFLLFAPNAFAVGSSLPTPEKTAVVHPEMAKKELSRKEKKEMRKEVKTKVKTAIKAAKSMKSDADLLLLVIIAILLPPLAMALYDGITNRFWISLLLTLLFFLPGVIYTLYVILSEK
jgi:uncharacterized membrane protein YqaE (UPF0057 family)